MYTFKIIGFFSCTANHTQLMSSRDTMADHPHDDIVSVSSSQNASTTPSENVVSTTATQTEQPEQPETDTTAATWVDIHDFFEQGPLRVHQCKAALPVATTYAHVYSNVITGANTNNTTPPQQATLPCAQTITRVDKASYPAGNAKAYSPEFKRYRCQVQHSATGETEEKEVFLKFSGVLDPNELVQDKYKDDEQSRIEKEQRPHNTAYVESLASFLTSKLTEDGVCPHFPRVYGVYNGVAEKHFVEFTEEYYDHRSQDSFQRGIRTNEWKMVPEMSDIDSDSHSEHDSESERESNDSDEEESLQNEFSLDKLMDIQKQSCNKNDDVDDVKKDTQDGVKNMMEMLMKSCAQNLENLESTDNDSVKKLTQEMTSLVALLNSAKDGNDNKSDTENKNTDVEKTPLADQTVSEADAMSEASNVSNDGMLPYVDIGGCQELSIDDIDVVEVKPHAMDGTNDNEASDTTATTTATVSMANLLNDESFTNTIDTHDEHLKVRSEIEGMRGYSDQHRFLQMSNVPVQVVAMEAYDTMFETLFQTDFQKLQHYETLYTRELYIMSDATEGITRKCGYKWLYATKRRVFEQKWTAILCQVCMALVAMQYQYDMVHNDMHGQNILLAPTTESVLHYRVNDQYYSVPTYGYVVKLIDLGRTTFQMKNTMYMGDVFADRGEAGEQYSYLHHYDNAVSDPEAREHLLLPNKCFDLTRLACSLLDEFFESAGVHSYDSSGAEQYPLAENDSPIYKHYAEHMFCSPTTSGFYNMLCEWITDCDKEPVNRFENFDLYKQIARRMRGTVPMDQLQRPHFKLFEVEHNSDTHYYNLTQQRNYHKAVDCSIDRALYDSDNEVYKQRVDYSSGEDNSDFDLNDLSDLNINDITETIQTLCSNFNDQ